MTDRLRPFVYRSPTDDNLVWDCAICARREITEAEEPEKYMLNGLPVCADCVEEANANNRIPQPCRRES